MGTFYNVKLYTDEFKAYPDRFKIGKERIIKLWLGLVKRRGYMTSGELIEALPDYASRIAIWHECMDENGQPTLNPKKYGAHVSKCLAAKMTRKALTA